MGKATIETRRRVENGSGAARRESSGLVATERKVRNW